MKGLKAVGAIVAIVVLGCAMGRANSFSGTIYYTTYTGGENVWSIQYNYDDTTNAFSLTNNTGLAALGGADGIIFDAGGNLLVGGQTTHTVYQGTGTGGPWTSASTGDGDSYHLALSPDGKTVYTSSFGGSLDTLPVGTAPGSLTNGATHAVSGDDTGLTQVAFAPNGNVYYVNGQPNGGGNVGLIDLSTDTTSRLYSNVVPAHGLIYDDWSGMITMFGRGYTGTIDPATNTLKTSSTPFACDFDQGATDGHGHAFVAGCGEITLLDYHLSGDITNPDYSQSIFVNGAIDDVAPLSGLGSKNQVPEPSGLLLLGSGLIGLIWCRRLCHG